MSDILEELKRIVDSGCLATIMKRKEGTKRFCEAKIDKRKYPHIIIDLDIENSIIDIHEKRPDYIFIRSDSYTSTKIAVVEISMGGNKDTSLIADQLQAGLNGIEKTFERVGNTGATNETEAFAVFCGDTDREMRTKLGKIPVYYGKRKLVIQVIACGDSLEKKILV